MFDKSYIVTGWTMAENTLTGSIELDDGAGARFTLTGSRDSSKIQFELNIPAGSTPLFDPINPSGFHQERTVLRGEEIGQFIEELFEWSEKLKEEHTRKSMKTKIIKD